MVSLWYFNGIYMVFISEAERRYLGCGWETEGQKKSPYPINE